MDTPILAALIRDGTKLLSHFLQSYAVRRPKPVSPPPEQESERVAHLTTDETIQYQKRAILKELLLLEGHLVEGCKINSKPCSCCEKHPIKLEALAQETASMTPDPVFRELAEWTREIAPITSEAAAASGKHDDEYPKLAIRAREFRKAIMPIGSHELSKKEVGDGETIPATEEGQ